MDEERVRAGPGASVIGIGRVILDGLVPDRLRNDSELVGVAPVVIIEGVGWVFDLNCAADADGRNIFREVMALADIEGGRDIISSPLAEGPTDEKFDPLWDFVSVEPLPLRFRRKYFSIAS